MPRGGLLPPIDMRRNDGARLATALRREILATLKSRANLVVPRALERGDLATAVGRIGNRRTLRRRARQATDGLTERVADWHRRRFRNTLRRLGRGRQHREIAAIARVRDRTSRNVGRFTSALVADFRRALVDIAAERPDIEPSVLVNLAARRASRRIGVVGPDIMRTFVADMNRVRQIDAGIDSYVWLTRRDGRVRPSHSRNEGRTFRWSSPPPTQHPGFDYGCRCVACGVLPRRR